MKPRSSTDTFASPMGRKSPLRYTIGSLVIWPRGRSLEPQAHGVESAAEDAGGRHFLQCDERELGHRLAVERHLDEADRLRALDRRDQRLLGFHRQRELV